MEKQKKYAEVLRTFKNTYIVDPSKRAIDNDWCQYKDTKTGNKCAVGMYIPDEAYSEDFEEKSVKEIFSKIKNYLPIDDVNFWWDLQNLHDTRENWDDLIVLNESYNHLVYRYCPKFKKELLIESEF